MLSVEVSEEDLLGLQALGAVAGVGESDSATFAEVLKSTFHCGVIESYKAAGLTWPGDHAGSAAEQDAGAVPAASRAQDVLGGRTGAQRMRSVALWTAAAATVIVIVGSYAGNWTWTGLTQNGQVWDWMQLLLLPVAIGAVPLWLRFSGQMSAARRKVLGGAVIAFAAFVLVGYLVPLRWTGFPGPHPLELADPRRPAGHGHRRDGVANDRPDFPSRLSLHRRSDWRRMDRNPDRRVRRRLGVDRVSRQHPMGVGAAAARADRHHHVRGARAHQDRVRQRRRRAVTRTQRRACRKRQVPNAEARWAPAALREGCRRKGAVSDSRARPRARGCIARTGARTAAWTDVAIVRRESSRLTLGPGRVVGNLPIESRRGPPPDRARGGPAAP